MYASYLSSERSVPYLFHALTVEHSGRTRHRTGSQRRPRCCGAQRRDRLTGQLDSDCPYRRGSAGGSSLCRRRLQHRRTTRAEFTQQKLPPITIVFPAAQQLYSLQSGLTHTTLKRRIIRQLLHSFSQSSCISDRNNKP